MILLGIDASLSSTGYCVMETNGNKIIKTGVIQTKKDSFETEDLRIVHICNSLQDIIIKNKVDISIVENQFIARNSQTVLSLRKLLGAIMYMCFNLDIQLDYLYPTTTRKLLLNNGKAKKKDVANYIRENSIDIGEYSDKTGKKKTSDIYDAIALVLAYNIKIKNEGE